MKIMVEISDGKACSRCSLLSYNCDMEVCICRQYGGAVLAWKDQDGWQKCPGCLEACGEDSSKEAAKNISTFPLGRYCYSMKPDPSRDGDYLDPHINCENLSDECLGLICLKFDVPLKEIDLADGACCIEKCPECLEACEESEK